MSQPYGQPDQGLNPPKRTTRQRFKTLSQKQKGLFFFVLFLLLLTLCVCGNVMNSLVASSPSVAPTPTPMTNAVTPLSTSEPTPTPEEDTPTPLPVKPTPTVSAAEVAIVYKLSTTDKTIDTLDKEGSADSGMNVHFTGTLLDFVKDTNGNTVGANVDDPTSSSGSVIQLGFPTHTDLSQVNIGDTVEVWGLDGGASSGTNSFGATIQEVVVAALYMTDQTTGYQASDN